MPRLFTLEEALTLLPSLRQIVGRMQAAKAELDDASARLDGLIEKSAGNGHGLGEEIARLRTLVENLAAEIEALLAEVTDLGCEMKGVDQGLVDFQSLRDGRIVCLCWRLGEETIAFWHELDTGFAGRQPL
jgi:hypothetical protein